MTHQAPEKWKVGMLVEYVRDMGEFGPNKGDRGKIAEVRNEDERKAGDEYQVFWVRLSEGIFWTTPDDVVLIEDAP
jgi:hypothetical protein